MDCSSKSVWLSNIYRTFFWKRTGQVLSWYAILHVDIVEKRWNRPMELRQFTCISMGAAFGVMRPVAMWARFSCILFKLSLRVAENSSRTSSIIPAGYCRVCSRLYICFINRLNHSYQHISTQRLGQSCTAIIIHVSWMIPYLPTLLCLNDIYLLFLWQIFT